MRRAASEADARLRQRESSPIATTGATRPRPGRVDERGLVRLSDRGQVAAGLGDLQHLRAHAPGRAIRLVSRSRNGTWLIAAAMPASRAAATSACPPPREDPNVAIAVGVDARQRAGERDRRVPVLELALRVGQIRLAGAVAEAAIVEHQRRDPGLGEALGERAQPIASRARQAVRHDDQRGGGVWIGGAGRVEPGGAGVRVRSEGQIVTAHNH